MFKFRTYINYQIETITMKKFIISFSMLIAFAFVASTFTSCGGGCDESQATEDASRVADLAIEYLSDPENEDKCKAYVDAVRDFVNDYGDCDDVDPADVAEIEDGISGLPCS